MSSRPTAIGVDIGGSFTKMGLVAADGEILIRAMQPTPPTLSGETHMQAILGKLAELVEEAKRDRLHPRGIGVSVCGYLSASGEEPDYINLHALDHYPVLSRLREAFGLPVV